MGLLRNIARLRRAQRRLPADADLSAVRIALEEQLGETVSQRLAARYLGVSHTALGHWVKSGDLPLVESLDGRRQVPVASLLDLAEEVERERRRGGGSGHLLEPSMRRGRERAQRLPPAPVPAEAGHDRGARLALAYHAALAPRLTRAMVAEARHRIDRWDATGRLDRRLADRWREILARPLTEVRAAIAADGEQAEDLRQSSPFAGMLSEPERRRLLEGVR